MGSSAFLCICQLFVKEGQSKDENNFQFLKETLIEKGFSDFISVYKDIDSGINHLEIRVSKLNNKQIQSLFKILDSIIETDVSYKLLKKMLGLDINDFDDIFSKFGINSLLNRSVDTIKIL